jgi:hypothetical protein
MTIHMNTEQNGELPSITMPEHGAQAVSEAPASAAAPEMRNAPGPSVASSSRAAANAAVPAMAPPMMAPADPVVPTAQSQPGNPAIADDVDLIEKEWVDKAKQIVEMTRSEPYEQKQEVSRLKADYMQKRYNKTVKVDG